MQEQLSDAIASSIELPTRLNNTPQPRENRHFFYRDAAESAIKALQTGAPRYQMRCTIPETNPEMDVYRVGTVLEMVREVANKIAQDGRRVRVCVQGSLGKGVFQGLPLSLSGVPLTRNTTFQVLTSDHGTRLVLTLTCDFLVR
jgi:adenylate kinase